MDTKALKEAYDSTQPQWYIFRNCHQFGPLTSKEICDLLKTNQITSDHHIWHVDFNDWAAIKDVEVFQNVGFGISFPKGHTAFIEDHHVSTEAHQEAEHLLQAQGGHLEEAGTQNHESHGLVKDLWGKLKGLLIK
ncbi:MAG: DUF4339 domain-containing protein [Bdellovibrionaceae bacterium]|nr:DUF4339 domain-containing protein [Pseudobdellovibrionaceae bacterium]